MARTAIAAKELVAQGVISSANIVGTAAGQLGHANGFPMVPAYGADQVAQLVSAMLAMDFSVAAYTGGGNVTVNIGSGGAALTGLVANTNFIQVAADKVIFFVPLAATFLTLVANKSINLVDTSAPTQPGTAAGVIRYRVVYRVFDAGLA